MWASPPSRAVATSGPAHTDPTVQVLDDLQYGLNEGPCVDALSEKVDVSVPDIRNDRRWPHYVEATLRSTSLKSQLAVQLFLDDKNTVGTLNLYSTSQRVVDPDAIGIADLFAAHAAVASAAPASCRPCTTRSTPAR